MFCDTKQAIKSQLPMINWT